ncbi:MAG: type IV pilus biogenesis/stability protein PilW, partial [Gammaproteobacteria bacterium]|nr:type IV pilus biogenesis/stability protein PilW [Gammaproteobacteria bacterium]
EQYFIDAAGNPGYATPEVAWTNAGVCVKKVPDDRMAETYFRTALQVNPRFGDALLQMAVLSHEKGNHLQTRAFIQRYEEVGALDAEMLWIAVQAETNLGDINTARRYGDRIRREYPTSPQMKLLIEYSNND